MSKSDRRSKAPILSDFLMPYSISVAVKMWFFPSAALFFVLWTLSACGLLGNNHEKDYLKSKTINEMKVPNDLQQPVNRNPINIPPVADDYVPPEDIIIPPPLTQEEVQLAIVESSASGASDEATTENVELDALNANIETDADFEVTLLVDEKFDIVWGRVAKALFNLGYVIEDKNQLTQYYTVYKQILKIDFDEDDISKPKELELEKSPDREYYKIKVSEEKSAAEDQKKTRIAVLDRTGDSLGSDLDKHLLVQIKQQFENPPEK